MAGEVAEQCARWHGDKVIRLAAICCLDAHQVEGERLSRGISYDAAAAAIGNFARRLVTRSRADLQVKLSRIPPMRTDGPRGQSCIGINMESKMRKHFTTTRIASVLAGCLALTGFGSAHAQERCDRACMSSLADGLVSSMVAHRPQDVPLTEYYRATNNGVPASLPFMDLWRTLTDFGERKYYIDTTSKQMFIMTSVSEGPTKSLLWGRLKLDGRQFSEIELYLTRSRGDAGFIFGNGTLEDMPTAWTKPVEQSRIPSREELLEMGKAIFMPSMPLPQAGTDCELIENAGSVREEDEWMSYLPQNGAAPAPAPKPKEGSEKRTVLMSGVSCPLAPTRPGDENARVDVVDTQEGVVVSIGTVEGLVFNYPVTEPTWSAFVPDSLRGFHEATLKNALATGKYREPKLVTMRTSAFVGNLLRVYDGKVQGLHLLEKLTPTGAVSPWGLPPVDAVSGNPQ